jgi:ubiquinone/menaquinone biosynthesis C-methylase UbiE
LNPETQKQIQIEFTQQAERMASAAAFGAEPVLSWIVRAVEPSVYERVLDLACGPGIVAEVIAPHVRQVVGVDITPAMIRLASRRLAKTDMTNGLFAVASAEALPFEENEFD